MTQSSEFIEAPEPYLMITLPSVESEPETEVYLSTNDYFVIRVPEYPEDTRWTCIHPARLEALHAALGEMIAQLQSEGVKTN